MTNALPSLGRRRALQLVSSLPFLARAPSAWAFPATPALAEEGAAILVAGPEGGELDRWGHLIGPLLSRYLTPSVPLRVATSGAADGVTGANQFAARAAPDGNTLLMVPGAAARAWLVGDQRARFDAGLWVPMMAVVGPALVVARPGTLAAAGQPRTAVAGPADVAGVLALDLMGTEPRPVFGLVEPGAVTAAVAAGEVDAVLVTGRNVPGRLAALATAGAVPAFSLGATDTDGRPARDIRYPGVPDMSEVATSLRGAPPSGRLYAAWLAAASAARLDFGLVLPQLTPASLVAQWRRAGTLAAAAPEFQAAASAAGVQPLTGFAAAASTAAVAPDAAELLELRRWLASRFEWRPG